MEGREMWSVYRKGHTAAKDLPLGAVSAEYREGQPGSPGAGMVTG
jgi:hypothetical protein